MESRRSSARTDESGRNDLVFSGCHSELDCRRVPAADAATAGEHVMG